VERKEEQKISPIEGVVYVVRDKSGRFLVAKRIKPGSNFFGEHLFPGGEIEDSDESPKFAVAREVKEERGANVHESLYLDSTSYPHPNGNLITQHVFLIEDGGYTGEMGNLEPEKEELTWEQQERLSELCTSTAGKAVLNLLRERGVIEGEKKED
jgi:8-oxo-dGTP pyrophosphatase MutT (NUDIX family)